MCVHGASFGGGAGCCRLSDCQGSTVRASLSERYVKCSIFSTYTRCFFTMWQKGNPGWLHIDSRGVELLDPNSSRHGIRVRKIGDTSHEEATGSDGFSHLANDVVGLRAIAHCTVP